VRRILHIVPSLDYNAAARQLTLLAAQLPRDRCEVRVVVLQTAGPWAQLLREAGVPVEVFSWTRLIDPQPLLRLRRCLAEFQPDILHVWRLAALRWGLLVNGFARRRIIVSMPFTAAAGGSQLGWLDRGLLGRADHVVAWGPFEAERHRRLGVPERKLVIIPPGVMVPERPAAAPALRRLLGFKDTARLVLGIGPLEAHKGFRDAIWALELIHHLCGDLNLVLVGAGPDRARLERFTRLIQARPLCGPARRPGRGPGRVRGGLVA
jgi:glycosyltransferase involved in cell wall biosynthesis